MSQLRLNALKMYNAEAKNVHVYKKTINFACKKG